MQRIWSSTESFFNLKFCLSRDEQLQLYVLLFALMKAWNSLLSVHSSDGSVVDTSVCEIESLVFDRYESGLHIQPVLLTQVLFLRIFQNWCFFYTFICGERVCFFLHIGPTITRAMLYILSSWWQLGRVFIKGLSTPHSCLMILE